MKLKLWLFLFFVFLIPFSAKAQQYEAMRIAKIDISLQNLPPNTDFNSNAVRERLLSKVGNYFSQADFDSDLKKLSEEYDRVDPSIEVVNNEIHITLRLWLKPRIRKIEYTGNQAISEKKLKKTLAIEPGSIFDREAFIQAFNKLKLLYIKKGYFEAELDYETIPVEGDNQIDILIKIFEGRAGKIKDILFEGLTSDEEDELLKLMVSKKYHLLLSWYSGKGIYHTEMLEHDRLQIINYLQDEGFADATVDFRIQEIEGQNRINLLIAVDKGQKYCFGRICFQGNFLFSNEQIWERILFRPNDLYSPEQIRGSVKAINDLYGGCGYIDAAVDAQLSLREDCPIYDVVITIEEGEQYYIGLVRVFGNTITQTKVILHETLLCPGDVFDMRKLEGTEARLCNTGFFNNVNVYAVRSQLADCYGARCYRDVFIEVEEGETGNVGVFAGFSSLDRIFAGVEITERNFNIAGVSSLFASKGRSLRGGGEFVHAKANFGGRATSYVLQWSKPYFLDTPWILGVELEKTNNRALSRGYDIYTYGGSIHTTYIQNLFLKYDIHYRARHSTVHVRDKDNIQLDELARQEGLISAAGFSIIYDSTDHPRRPTTGIRSRFMCEVAGLGGRFRFVKFAYLNSYYYPFTERGTFKFRADLQFIKTYGGNDPDDVPLSERFFLGGETTVRGYRSYIIGPKAGNNEPLGGVSALLLSEEYQYNLLTCPCLDGFIFLDAGYVSGSEFTLGKPAASVGFGIRVEVMRNMPLMMGFGWPIHPMERLKNGQKVNNSQHFFFTVGGCF